MPGSPRKTQTTRDFASTWHEAHSRLGDINRLLEKHGKRYRSTTRRFLALKVLRKTIPARSNTVRRSPIPTTGWGKRCASRWSMAAPRRSAARMRKSNTMKPCACSNKSTTRSQQTPIYQQELARTYYNRGILSFDNKDLNHAESDFRQAVAATPTISGGNAEHRCENTNPAAIAGLGPRLQ